MTTETIQQQCARRVIERTAFREMAEDFGRRADAKAQHKSKVLGSLIVRFNGICVDQALSRLPKSASFELRRQVIKEASE